MGLSFSTGSQNAIAASLATRADADAGPATVKVYTGAKPSPNAAPTGTLLLTFTLEETAFAAPTAPLVIANLPKSATGVAAGTAGWWRLASSGGSQVVDGTAGATESGSDMEFSTTTVSVGLTVNLTGGTIVIPAS